MTNRINWHNTVMDDLAKSMASKGFHVTRVAGPIHNYHIEHDIDHAYMSIKKGHIVLHLRDDAARIPLANPDYKKEAMKALRGLFCLDESSHSEDNA